MTNGCLNCSGQLEEEIEKRDWRIADLERDRLRLLQTILAIAVNGIGLSEPDKEDAPAEWLEYDTLSQAVAAIREKNAELRKQLELSEMDTLRIDAILKCFQRAKSVYSITTSQDALDWYRCEQLCGRLKQHSADGRAVIDQTLGLKRGD